MFARVHARIARSIHKKTHDHRVRLGLGDTERRGDDFGEMGDNLPAVDLGTGACNVAVIKEHRASFWGPDGLKEMTMVEAAGGR